MRFKHHHRAPTDLSRWHVWFAWRPVTIGEHWIWLETVERRFVSHRDGADIEYREVNEGRGRYPAGWP